MAIKGDQEFSFNVEKRSTPEFLYKYCRLNEDNREWIERIFRHNELYFSSPPQFNNPFDCRVQASINATDDDWEEYLDGMLKGKHPDWDYDDRQIIVRELIKEGWMKNPVTQQKIVDALQEAVNKVGVYCLSEVYDDILMWSHYADGHRGFCMQFRIKPEMYPFGKLLFKVEYASTYPQITILREREDQTRKALLTKAYFLKHEKEWRILDPDNGPGIRVYQAEMLAGIIFGCEMPHESRQLIREWTKGREIPLKFHQTVKKETEFGLDIIQAIG
jgi:hypothetical protein